LAVSESYSRRALAHKNAEIQRLKRQLEAFKKQNMQLATVIENDIYPKEKEKLKTKGFSDSELNSMTPYELCNLSIEVDRASEKPEIPKVRRQKPHPTIGSLLGKSRKQILKENQRL